MKQMEIKWWDIAQTLFTGMNEGKVGQRFARYFWFANRLPPLPATVLEIGCSSGEALAEIADEGYKCYAVDFPNIIAKIDKHPKIKYIGMNVDGPDGTAWKKEWAEKFDAIICGEVLQHVIFDENVLYACWHYLKPGGKLLLSTENVNLAHLSVHYYPANIILKMLEALNFKILEHTTQGQPDYIWICAEKIEFLPSKLSAKNLYTRTPLIYGDKMTEDLKLLLIEKGFSPLIAEDVADQLKDALDIMMEAIYMVTKVIGGEVSYTYTTKAEHEVEMILRAK